MAHVKPRVCVVTAGHLSTCPRMLKAADALATRYDVRVVSTRHTPWATTADARIAPTRGWRWTVVDYDRRSAPTTYAWSGARQRTARTIVRALGSGVVPRALTVRAYSRVHTELVRATLTEPADFIYGGTTGAIAAVAEAARRAGVPYAIDLEDFHVAEHAEPEGALSNALADRVIAPILGGARFVTTSSVSMAGAYARRYGIAPLTVHNTFPLPRREPSFARSSDPLRLYWFSQTIGPGRGLEDVVRAVGEAGVAARLTLRGRPADGYLQSLLALSAAAAPALRVDQADPADPDSMIDLCRDHDIGLATEQPDVPNHRLALSNKALTYPLAGLALVVTDTPGHRELARDVDGSLLVEPGDIRAMADGLRRWALDRARLVEAQASAWHAARRRWHWEHGEERGALLGAAAAVLG